MNESDAVVAAITAWAAVRLTQLTLAHRRAQRAADRKAKTNG